MTEPTCPALAKHGICGRTVTRPEGTCGLHARAERARRSQAATHQWHTQRVSSVEVWFIADDPSRQRRVRNPVETRLLRDPLADT